MVQPTQPWKRNDGGMGSRPLLYCTPVRCVLFQRVVKPILLMVVHVITHDSAKMFLVQRDHMVQHLPPATADPALGDALCQGACTLVRFGSEPAACKKPLTSASNFGSRSKIT